MTAIVCICEVFRIWSVNVDYFLFNKCGRESRNPIYIGTRQKILKDYSPIAVPSINKSWSGKNRGMACALEKWGQQKLLLRATVDNKAVIVNMLVTIRL